MYPTNMYIYYVYLKQIFVVVVINIDFVVSETGSHVAQGDFELPV